MSITVAYPSTYRSGPDDELPITSTSSFFSHSATPAQCIEDDLPTDLVSFLAVAQKLKIDFLPITWQPALEELGEGGTARIRQSLVTLRLSFAFKRNKLFSTRAFQALTSEISVLGHPAIRYHQNVVRLEGICWDFPNEDEAVRPVLVFEKARHGDLEKFSDSKAGKDLSFKDRLKVCVNVANAILAMHSCGIIHRDIKPQNVLIFRDTSGSYVAKVADFGYSIRTTGENDLVKLPHSRLWNAPEWHDRGFRSSEAKKSDAYSFGLLCLWFLFREIFSRILDTPEYECGNENDDVPFIELREGLLIRKFLLESKAEGMLHTLAHRLMTVAGLDNEYKNRLDQFFKLTLECDPAKRCSDFVELGRLLERDNVGLLPDLRPAEDHSQLFQAQFRVAVSMNQFCQADYRVRSQIFLHLRQKVSQCTNKPHFETSLRNAAFQLAFCYKLGFGVAKDDSESRNMLRKSIRSSEELEQEIDLVKRGVLLAPYHWGNFGEMLLKGQITIDLAEYYREHGLLINAGIEHMRELADMVSVLEHHHKTVILLKSIASRILSNQGRLDESEDLKTQVVETSKIVLGNEHPDTLTSMNNLSLAYREKGKWKQAEDLLLQTMKLSTRTFGDSGRSMVGSLSNLAATLYDQGRWREALKMKTQVVQIEMKVFGQSHPRTLTGMGNLAATMWNLGMWRQAMKLEKQVLETSKKVLGLKHPGTLTSMRNLALTLKDQGQWVEAEDMQIRLLRMSRQVLGQDHPTTLSNITNLAVTFWSRGRWSEAEDLENQTLEIKRRMLGPKHPATLTSMANLAAFLRSRGFWKRAEALKEEVRDLSIEVLGPEHPDTLNSMGNLAVSYRDREQYKAAEDLQLQVMNLSKKVFGPKHPSTLTSMINLAATYLDQKRYKEAVKLNTQVMKLRAIVLGKEHPDTLNSMANLAAIFSRQRRSDEAESLEGQVLEIRKRVLGPEHPDTLTSMANLGATYDSQGRLNEALELHREALDLRRKVLGEEHRDTVSSLEWIRVLSTDLQGTLYANL